MKTNIINNIQAGWRTAMGALILATAFTGCTDELDGQYDRHTGSGVSISLDAGNLPGYGTQSRVVTNSDGTTYKTSWEDGDIINLDLSFNDGTVEKTITCTATAGVSGDKITWTTNVLEADLKTLRKAAHAADEQDILAIKAYIEDATTGEKATGDNFGTVRFATQGIMLNGTKLTVKETTEAGNIYKIPLANLVTDKNITQPLSLNFRITGWKHASALLVLNNFNAKEVATVSYATDNSYTVTAISDNFTAYAHVPVSLAENAETKVTIKRGDVEVAKDYKVETGKYYNIDMQNGVITPGEITPNQDFTYSATTGFYIYTPQGMANVSSVINGEMDINGQPITKAAKSRIADGDYTSANITLAGDLDMTGINYIPICQTEGGRSYTGTFDGKGYTISNLTIQSEDKNVGLIGCMGSRESTSTVPKVQNLTIENAKIEGSNNVGCVIGSMEGDCKVVSCTIMGEVSVTANNGYNVGAIYGTGYDSNLDENTTPNDGGYSSDLSINLAVWDDPTEKGFTYNATQGSRGEGLFTVKDGCGLIRVSMIMMGQLSIDGKGQGSGSPEKHYLKADIVIDESNVTVGKGLNMRYVPKGLKYLPIGTKEQPYMGVFNGNFREIKRLTLERPTESHLAFIAYLGIGAEVKDLKCMGISIKGTDYLGGIVAHNLGGKINNCDVRIPLITGTGSHLGGIVGYNDAKGIVSYGTVVADPMDILNGIEGQTCVGGVVGTNAGKVNNNEVTTISVKAKDTTNGIAGGIVGNNLTDGIVTANTATNAEAHGAQSSIGGIVGTNSGSVTNNMLDGNKCPSGNDAVASFSYDVDANKFTINTAYGLVQVSRIIMGYIDLNGNIITAVPTTPNEYYLNADISFSADAGNINFLDVPDGIEYKPLGNADHPYLGTFDGSGVKISNFYMGRRGQVTGSYVGIIGHLGTNASGAQIATKVGKIQNVDLSGVEINGGEYLGALVGKNDGGIITGNTIKGIQGIKGTIDGSTGQPLYESIGVLAGYTNAGTITNNTIIDMSDGPVATLQIPLIGVTEGNPTLTNNKTNIMYDEKDYDYEFANGVHHFGVRTGLGLHTVSQIINGKVAPRKKDGTLGEISSDLYRGAYIDIHEGDSRANMDMKNYATYEPIGTVEKPFYGVFNGGNMVIPNLTLDINGDYVGIIGYLGTATIEGTEYVGNVRNVQLTTFHIKGKNYVGALVGYNKGGLIHNCVLSKDDDFENNNIVEGTSYVGALVGFNDSGNGESVGGEGTNKMNKVSKTTVECANSNNFLVGGGTQPADTWNQILGSNILNSTPVQSNIESSDNSNGNTLTPSN